MDNNRIGTQGWSAHLLMNGGDAMTVFESLSLMLTFGLFVIVLLSFHKKKQTSLELGEPGGLTSDTILLLPIAFGAIYCQTVDVGASAVFISLFISQYKNTFYSNFIMSLQELEGAIKYSEEYIGMGLDIVE